ncbi:hypothetical protein D3C75_789640 [compost metagenome]
MDHRSNVVDPLVNTVHTHCLGTQDLSRTVKDQLQGQGQRSGIIGGMGVGMDIGHVIGDAQAGQRFFVIAGGGSG